MNMQLPAVEILMATYNGEKYLREQIDSIVIQTNSNWHLTISDDGSSDLTSEIVDEYVSRYPDKITRYESGKCFGNARDHFFHLMCVCKADYMFFCDQDDVWYPDKLDKMMNVMIGVERGQSQKVPLLVFSDQTPTDEKKKPLSPSLMRYQQQYFEEIDYRALLMQNIVTGGAMVINRALADLASCCIDHTQAIMHDWWLAVVAARFGNVIYMDESTGIYRQHGKNSVGAKDVRSIQHVLHKIGRMTEIRRTILSKKKQAHIFMESYELDLSEEDRTFLKSFARRHSGPLFYLRHRYLIHGFFRFAGMMVLG